MPEAAKIMQIGTPGEAITSEAPQDFGENQLEGESQLWYRRYCIYRDLGHKRSLRAAVAKERETVRLLKEPQTATKSKKGMAKSRQNPPKTDIAPEPVIHVPGSWRDASKRFHWVDRAQDFDAWILSAATISAYKALQDSFANKYKRIKLLDALIASGVEQLNTACTQAHGGLQHTRYLAYLRQIAMLAKQMENEMNNFSPDEMKAAIVAHGRTQMDEIEKVWIKHD